MKKQRIKTEKQAVHIVPQDLLNPANPITVNLIGAGGTGSHALTALAKINHALTCLGHPGLFVQLFDDDKVSKANLGRQLFAEAEVGMYKSAVLINRNNCFFGTNWRAVCERYSNEMFSTEQLQATVTISCVDTVAARFEIARILKEQVKAHSYYHRNRPVYWMDFGNSKNTGQVIVATIGEVQQPSSKKFRTVAKLPFITDEYRDLLTASEDSDDTPSCSVAEALARQDLFINPSLANVGSSLLWQMFREGMLFDKGFFINLKNYRMQPIKVA